MIKELRDALVALMSRIRSKDVQVQNLTNQLKDAHRQVENCNNQLEKLAKPKDHRGSEKALLYKIKMLEHKLDDKDRKYA